MYYQNLENSFIYKGKKLKLDFAFNTVLLTMEVQRDKELEDIDKIEIILELLVINYHKVKKLSLIEKNDLLNEIYKIVIEEPKHKSNSDVKTVDFKQDENYIYSSFMACYGIDLHDMRGKLHWKKFIALFQGLTSDTKIREVMEIRGRRLPKPTKHNAEEIQNLQELKAYYSLDDTQENYQNGLNKLFAQLAKMAE